MFRSIIILVLINIYFGVNAQYIELGGSLGGATYQGDISHLSSKFSFQGAKMLNGLHIGYHFNDYYALKLKYTKGSIGADDIQSVDVWRRDRNLHFRSEIREWSLTNEIELLDVLKFFHRYNLKPYLTFGISWFRFNPQAKFRGQWYDLQPTSTEGQGLPGSKLSPYSLSQISVPFGFGFKYHFNENLYFGFEISPRITFTDYLDDVSGDYPDFDILRQYKGDLSVQLSYQGDKKPGGIPFSEFSTDGRGNPKDNDWYIFNSFIVGFKINPVDYMKRKRSFKQGRKCNFF